MDVKGLVIVLAGARPQRLRSAGLINRRVFLELGENDLPVLSLEGAAHRVIDQRQQDDGAQGKDQCNQRLRRKAKLRRRLFSMKFTAASNDQPHDFR